ncbi:MAG TPA: hypothetical protein VK077_10375 [Virgibacillus sp.]|nr:hypothetical protein [Virgibacillus sp.]
MKRIGIYFSLVVMFIFMSVACSDKSTDTPTISVSEESTYENTFTDLNLGVLFDFNLHLPHADHRWIKLWVEKYENGKKDTEPLTKISYGNFPDESIDHHLGFGIIDPNNDEGTLGFLYGSNMRTELIDIRGEFDQEYSNSLWDKALGEDDLQLRLNEPTILAAYRETDNHTIEMVDLQDETSVNRMIEQNNLVLLLKIMIEEEQDQD